MMPKCTDPAGLDTTNTIVKRCRIAELAVVLEGESYSISNRNSVSFTVSIVVLFNTEFYL